MELKSPLDGPPAYEAPPAYMYMADCEQTAHTMPDQSPLDTKNPNFPPCSDYPPPSLPCYPTFGLPPISDSEAAPHSGGRSEKGGAGGAQNEGAPQSFCKEIVISCIATWFCVLPIGLAAFIFAMLARDRSRKGRATEARSLARTSIGVSVASAVAGACIVVVIIMMVFFVNPPGGGGGMGPTQPPAHQGVWV